MHVLNDSRQTLANPMASAGKFAAPTIEPLRRELIPDVVRALARAFSTNPLHIAAFGAPAQARNEAFFRTALQAFKGPVFVATLGSQVIGAVHWVGAPSCQFGLCERARTLPAMLGGLGFRSTLRLASWLHVWGRQDPPVPHLHLGPIGVSPEFQGRHIGHRLMARYCAELDRLDAGGYLETDRIENVTFYRSFGFEVTREVSALGVPNYLMWRRKVARSVL